MDQSLGIPLNDKLGQEIKRLQVEYLTYLDSLPEKVRPLVFKMDDPEESMSPGRFSVLALPFWVGEALGVGLETRRHIALANIYGLSHFIAQDRLTDGDWSGDSWQEEIPALVLSGTLYLQQMFSHYQSYFPPRSTFWPLLNKYWLEWADSITWEREVGLCPAFVEEDLVRAARKAAPLKICTTGLALLGGRENLITDLERAIDMMHMVMQMMDDLMDMAEDLASNRFNTALSLMVSSGTLVPQNRFEINQIGKAMFTSGDDVLYFNRMQDIADSAQVLLNQIGIPQWADLIQQTVQKAQIWRDLHVKELIPETLDALFEEST